MLVVPGLWKIWSTQPLQKTQRKNALVHFPDGCPNTSSRPKHQEGDENVRQTRTAALHQTTRIRETRLNAERGTQRCGHLRRQLRQGRDHAPATGFLCLNRAPCQLRHVLHQLLLEHGLRPWRQDCRRPFRPRSSYC